MARTLQEVLDTDLSADKVKDMKTCELVKFLVDNKIISEKADANMLIIEGVQRALNEDDEFPIHYYEKTEPMSEAGKVVENPGEMLTDTLVHQMKGTYGE